MSPNALRLRSWNTLGFFCFEHSQCYDILHCRRRFLAEQAQEPGRPGVEGFSLRIVGEKCFKQQTLKQRRIVACLLCNSAIQTDSAIFKRTTVYAIHCDSTFVLVCSMQGLVLQPPQRWRPHWWCEGMQLDHSPRSKGCVFASICQECWFHEPQILGACWVLDHRQDRPVKDLEPKSGVARRPVFGLSRCWGFTAWLAALTQWWY